VLACLEDIHGGGREQRFPEGSAESEALRARSQLDEQHWQMPFPDIAKELGIIAARSTIESVFHLQHNIFRRRPVHKPFLSEYHIEARLVFAHIALHIAIHTIVFTDERWVEFNSARGKNGQVSRVVGEDPYKWTIHDRNDESTIGIMFWGAIALGIFSKSKISSSFLLILTYISQW